MKHFIIILFMLLFQITAEASAQCMSVPVPLAVRAANASQVVLAELIDSHSFIAPDGNIYTAYRVQVRATLSGSASEPELVVLGLGGVVGDQAQITTPTLRLQPATPYVLTLGEAQTAIHDPALPATLKQCFAVADAQGAIPGHNGWFYDAFATAPIAEGDLLNQLSALTGYDALTPDGLPYQPREAGAPVRAFGPMATITGFSPNFTQAGTVETGDFLTISGTGFGSSTGTVSFKNADNGGIGFTQVSVASDIIAWSNTSITVKVPSGAGTGTVMVNGTSSTQQLTIGYGHVAINSDFSGFSATTRQRYLLRSKNGSGGYTFVFNTTFAQNSAAVAAINRALETWRCETGINWKASGTTSTTFAKDDQNVILFDASLPTGVLARTTSRFSGSGSGSCSQANTVWWLNEVDIQFQPTPTSTSNWEFGPAAASSNEYDFESVAVHELGHAHGLAHRIASGEVMHFSISNGEVLRSPGTTEVDGASDKVAYSVVTPCFTPTNSGAVHVKNTANCVTGVAAPDQPDWYVDYALPDALHLVASDEQPFTLKVMDIQGRIVYQGQATGKATITISDWPSGVYMLHIETFAEESLWLKAIR